MNFALSLSVSISLYPLPRSISPLTLLACQCVGVSVVEGGVVVRLVAYGIRLKSKTLNLNCVQQLEINGRVWRIRKKDEHFFNFRHYFR